MQIIELKKMHENGIVSPHTKNMFVLLVHLHFSFLKFICFMLSCNHRKETFWKHLIILHQLSYFPKINSSVSRVVNRFYKQAKKKQLFFVSFLFFRFFHIIEVEPKGFPKTYQML